MRKQIILTHIYSHSLTKMDETHHTWDIGDELNVSFRWFCIFTITLEVSTTLTRFVFGCFLFLCLFFFRVCCSASNVYSHSW